MNDPFIYLTNRQDLRSLMSLEFHENGSKQFSDKEVQNYLQRLTKEQKNFFKYDNVPNNRLTAFITFGDGFFDRSIGGYFDTEPGKDNIRPNASFALFYKTKEKGKINVELVFYTRFFVISYSSGKHSSIVRSICRNFDKNPDNDRLKQDIFEAMRKNLHWNVFKPLSGSNWNLFPPRRYGLRLEDIIREGFKNDYFPYTLIKMQSGGKWSNTPNWFKGNTIHGMYNTKGCWMFLRNYLWDYPNENIGDTYQKLMNCFMKYQPMLDPYRVVFMNIESEKNRLEDQKRRGILSESKFNERWKMIQTRNKAVLQKTVKIMEMFAKSVQNNLPAMHPVKDYSADKVIHWLLQESRNYSYYRFIHTFAGINYNEKFQHIPVVSSSGLVIKNKPELNGWKYTTSNKMKGLLYNTEYSKGMKNKKNNLEEPWSFLFLFQRTDRFTHDTNDKSGFK